MRKFDVLFLIVVAIVLLLVTVNLIVEKLSPMQVKAETFKCSANQCILNFELYNNSNELQVGVVTIHYRESSSLAAAKAITVFRTTKKSFEISAFGSQTYSDSFQTKREKVEYYFAFSTN